MDVSVLRLTAAGEFAISSRRKVTVKTQIGLNALLIKLTVWASLWPRQEPRRSGAPNLSCPTLFFPVPAAPRHPDLQGPPTPWLPPEARGELHDGLSVPHEAFRTTHVRQHLLSALLGSRGGPGWPVHPSVREIPNDFGCEGTPHPARGVLTLKLLVHPRSRHSQASCVFIHSPWRFTAPPTGGAHLQHVLVSALCPSLCPSPPPNLQEVSATEAFLSGHDTLRDFQEMKTLKKKKVNFSKH